ncbi:MAG TPA: thrombospondin type 3 repeat-containing protein [Myxococcaceae bacterium]|nr:thrombospondin type 3 repeat-containing protein [Myxococcaceae bacterium]
MRLPLLLLAVTVVAPLAAQATPNFPAAIARDLKLSAPPACTICHATNEGGSGTVVKPFGKYLVSRGLAPFDESSLAGSLAAAQGEHHDTDGDGISDIEALQQGLDPNGAPSSGPQLEDPTFGCSATRGGAGNTFLLALVVGLRLAASHLCRLRGARAPHLDVGTSPPADG